jgi:hypothetical protein
MTHRSDIARWKQSLKHVRFCEAAPRQGEDREIFEIDIEIPEAEPAFLELLSSLGIELRRIQPEDTVARAGTSYTPQEWKKLTFPIPQFPHLAQPGVTTVAGIPAHFWVRPHHLQIVIAPAADPVWLDEDDFLRAKAIDDLISRRPAING